MGLFMTTAEKMKAKAAKQAIALEKRYRLATFKNYERELEQCVASGGPIRYTDSINHLSDERIIELFQYFKKRGFVCTINVKIEPGYQLKDMFMSDEKSLYLRKTLTVSAE